MGDLVWGIDFKNKKRLEPVETGEPSTAELRAIGLGIISSQEFQDELASSLKNPAPYDPVAVAVMRGGLSLDTPPEILSTIYESSLGFIAPEKDPA